MNPDTAQQLDRANSALAEVAGVLVDGIYPAARLLARALQEAWDALLPEAQQILQQEFAEKQVPATARGEDEQSATPEPECVVEHEPEDADHR